MRLLPVLAALGLIAVPATAIADTKDLPRVGVIVELAVNVDAGRADSLGAAMADALNRELRVDAFGGVDVARQLPPEGLPEECLAKPDCIKDVAARVDADQLLFVVMVQVGEDVQIDVSWVNVATGVVSARPRMTLTTEAQAVTTFGDAAERILPDAEPRSSGTVIVNGVEMTPGTPRHMKRSTWIVAGSGVVALGAGIALGLSARSGFNRCDRQDGGCDDGTLDGIGTRALFADVSLIVAAGAGIATAVLYFTSGTDSTIVERAPSIGVTPTTGGAILGLGGRF